MLQQCIDAIATELGATVARIERELNAKVAAGVAQINAASADLRAAMAEMQMRTMTIERELEARVSNRLAAIKDGNSVTLDDVSPVILAAVSDAVGAIPRPRDGEDGKNVDPETIRAMVDDAVGAIKIPEPTAPDMAAVEAKIAEMVSDVAKSIPVPRDGKSVDPDDIRAMVDEAVRGISMPPPVEPNMGAIEATIAGMVGRAVSSIPVPRDGKDVDPEAIRAMVSDAVAAIELPLPIKPDMAYIETRIAGLVAEAMNAIPKPRDGEDGKNVDLNVVREMVAEVVAALPPAKEGPPGRLPIVEPWSDRVYYQGEVVTFSGSTYQARADTGRSPPHDDWAVIASAGQHGRSAKNFRIRGTFDAAETYEELDVVAFNGASFVARQDSPGECPGDGWQLMSVQGRRGKPGDPGTKGDKGDKGDGARAVVEAAVDEYGVLTIRNSDGSLVECDFYPVLSKIQGRA